MALRAVLDHPKFTDLVRLLGLPRYSALGCLETLWHFTARYTPAGNIGKYKDEQIESWCGWEGVEGFMLEALRESGWIDADPEFRLVVHDWAQYADEFVHTDLARKCISFTDGTAPHSRRLNQEERERYNEWLAMEGREKRASGRPSLHGKGSLNAEEMQPKRSRNADEMQPKRSRNADEMQHTLHGNAAEMTKPEPVPEPEPEPGPVPSQRRVQGQSRARPVPGPEPEPGAEPEPLRSRPAEDSWRPIGATVLAAPSRGAARAPAPTTSPPKSSPLPPDVLEEIERDEYRAVRTENRHANDSGTSHVDHRAARPDGSTETSASGRRRA